MAQILLNISLSGTHSSQKSACERSPIQFFVSLFPGKLLSTDSSKSHGGIPSEVPDCHALCVLTFSAAVVQILVDTLSSMWWRRTHPLPGK